MTDNSTPMLGAAQVWTLTPQGAAGTTGTALTADAASFPWGWNWMLEKRLVALSPGVLLPGAMGTLTLTVLRGTRTEPASVRAVTYTNNLVAGMYVAVTMLAATPNSPAAQPGAQTVLDPNKILWWGFIGSIVYEEVQGTNDGIGQAFCFEVGHLLKQGELLPFKRVTPDGGYAETLTTPPTANICEPSGYIIGNAIQVGNLDGSGNSGYAFARKPEDCGTQASNLWTRWRLLRHVALACWPKGLPPLTIACADGSAAADPSGLSLISGYLNDTSVAELYDIRLAKIKDALDLLVTKSRGFNWTILPTQKGWTLIIYSYASDGTNGLPKNQSNAGVAYISPSQGENLDPSPVAGGDVYTTRVQVTNDTYSFPDQLIMEGGSIVFGATVGWADNNLKEGWKRGSGNQEDKYRQGSGTQGTLSLAVWLERNAMVRSAPALKDVYVRFGLYAYANGDVRVGTPTPGDGTSSANVPICPEVVWDGTSTVSINWGTSHCPYLPTASILRQIPWPMGVQTDGTDLRPPQNQYLTQFTGPKIFRYSADQNDPTSTDYPWIDFEARNGRQHWPSLHVDADDRGLALRVSIQQNEMLAKNHWRDAAGGTTTPNPSDIDPDGYPFAIDYTKLVFTIAVPSDQRMQVTIYRPGLQAPSQVRKPLRIRDENLQCWMMPVGTILALKQDGTPDRVQGGGTLFGTAGASGGGPACVMVRNDWPVLQKRAHMAAGWLFRKRTAVELTRARPDTPPAWARIGYMITKLQEAAQQAGQAQVTVPVNTVVDQVVIDFNPNSPRISARTGSPDMLSFAPVAGALQGLGGTVSPMLGGTVGTAVQAVQGQAAQSNWDTQRLPLILPKSSQPTYETMIIGGGNTLASGQAGIKSASVTQATQAWNPDVPGTYDDGIGYGALYDASGTKIKNVLIINNGSFVGYSLVASWQCLNVGQVLIPVAGGGNILCYQPGAT